MGDGQPEKRPRRRLTRTVERQAVDRGTGALLDLEWEEPVAVRRPKDQRASEPFAIAFPSGVAGLARMNLTGTDWAVLMELVGRMGFEDAFKYRTSEIAEALGVAAPHVSRSIRRLTDRGVLIPRGPRMTLINPDYFWRGRVPKRLEMLHRLDRERQLSSGKNRGGFAAQEES